MTARLPHLEVTVVSNEGVTSRLDGVSGETCPNTSAQRVDEDDVLTGLDSTDCLLVDQATIDPWRRIVADVTEANPSLPVGVLIAEEHGMAVPEALEAGATDYFPRSVCHNKPSLVARQLADTVQQTTGSEFEQMYRDLFENVSDGLVVHEPASGEIVDCNGQFCEMTGYSREELVGETIALITAPDGAYSYERAKEHIRRAQTEGPQLFEWHNQRRDGETFYCEIHLDVMQMHGEEYVLASARDITERKRREHEFEQIFNGVQDAISVLDPETLDILEANDAYLDLLGYDSVADLQAEGIEGLSVTSEGYTFEEGYEIHRRVATAGTPESIDWRAETQTGEERFLEVKIAPAVIGGEDVHVAIHRDITERKRREREFEQIFNGVNDIIAVHHPETGELLAVNDRLAAVTGYDRERILEMGAEGLTVATDAFDPDQVQRVIARVMDGEDVDPYEQAIQTADGDRRWLEVNPTRAVIDGQPRFLAIGRDVTTRRKRQQRLEIERDRRSALFENNPDPVLRLEDVDQRPVIREVNPAFEEVFGFDVDAVVGATVGDTLVPDDARDRYERFRSRVADGESVDGEAERLTVGGRREFAFKVIQLDMATETTTDAYVWYTDVSERRRRERAIQTLQRATTRMQRANTAQNVAQIAGESAKEAMEISETVCWLYDDVADQLEPVATTTADIEPDTVPSLTPDQRAYEAFESGEVVTDTDGNTPVALPHERAVMVPLGEHGLLAAGLASGARTDEVLLEVARTLAEQTATALGRVDRAQAVRRTKRRLQAIVDRIDEAIFFAPLSELTEADPAPDFVSSGYEDIWGQRLETVHERYEEGFFGTLHPDDVAGYRNFLAEIVSDVQRDGGNERYTTEYRIERPNGEIRWVESDFYPTVWDSDTPRIVIVSRDITARKERQRTLESFHDATAELTTAETVSAASEVAVDAAADVLDIPATAIYHYDGETATLVPTATGPAMPAPDELTPLSDAQSTAWDTFVSEQLHRVSVDTTSQFAVGPGSTVLLVPLGRNGILGVWGSDDELDTDAASILAATVEASLNRLRGERQLESRREELEAQTERAQRLDAVAELSQRVDAAITTSSSRAGIQEAVCAELTDMDPFMGAFIAAAEVGTDQLTPSTVAGIDRDNAEQALQTPSSPDTHPSVGAWHTGEPQVVNELVGSGRRSEWRQVVLKHGAGAVCAVPVTYNDVTHGVLTVIADEPNSFGEREVDVLSQLGTSIGYAITAVERQRALESDDTLELEFRGQQTDIQFARLARECDCRVRHDRTVRRQDGSVTVYYTAMDASETTAEAAARILPGDVSVVAQRDGETVLERQGSTWFGSLISEYGGLLRRGYATAAGVTVVVELPRETNTRTIVERLGAEYPSLELAAQRQHHDTAVKTAEVRQQLHERLSERQYEALETGYGMGYFDWPRESSGEDVAERLGITQPTVNKHIRLGERKVFDLLFGSERPGGQRQGGPKGG